MEECADRQQSAMDGSPSPQTNLITFPLGGKRGQSQPVSFDRKELDAILRVYGRKVSEGEWRDYAIDTLKDRAVFSIFLRTSEIAAFRIEKHPKLARKQGAFCVVSSSGQILKRGHELTKLLGMFDKKPGLVSARFKQR